MATKTKKPSEVYQNGGSENHILDFNTLEQEGLKFAIDGKEYETLPPESYGGRQIARIKRHTKVVERFGERLQSDDDEDITEEEIDRYEEAVQAIGQMIAPDVPKEDFLRLGDMQVQRLVGFFMDAVRGPSPSGSTESISES